MVVVQGIVAVGLFLLHMLLCIGFFHLRLLLLLLLLGTRPFHHKKLLLKLGVLQKHIIAILLLLLLWLLNLNWLKQILLYFLTVINCTKHIHNIILIEHLCCFLLIAVDVVSLIIFLVFEYIRAWNVILIGNSYTVIIAVENIAINVYVAIIIHS